MVHTDEGLINTTLSKEEVINLMDTLSWDELKLRLTGHSKERQLVHDLTSLGIEYKNNAFYWDSDVCLPEYMVDYLKDNADQADIASVKNFWTWSQLNPNPKSREMLFEHCKKYGLHITPSGMVVMYRNMVVKGDINRQLIEFAADVFTEVDDPKNIWIKETPNGNFLTHSTEVEGSYNLYTLIHTPQKYFDFKFCSQYDSTFTYEMGKEAVLPREQCDESQTLCSSGLHVAGKSWIKEGYFGDVGIVCLVNPMNVVSAPMKDGYGKVRVCALLPVAFVQYRDGEVSDIELDTAAWEYGATTKSEINRLVKDLAPDNSNNQYTFPEIISKFKHITSFEDVVVPKVVELGDAYLDEDGDDLDEEYSYNEEDSWW